MLPKAHLTSQSRMSGFWWVTIPSWLSGTLWPFFVQFFYVFLPPILNLPLLLGPWHFCPLLCWSLHEMFPWYLIEELSDQISCSVMSDSLRPHESQHPRPPCPSTTPGVHSDSRPSSQWCHPAISFSVIPFSSCPQSLLASESFPMSQLFAWGGRSTGVSALASFLPKKSQGWSPSEWTGWTSLQS